MEKINLPTSDDIAQEKELIETETQANKEVFQKTILKTLESFDATELKQVETRETTIQVVMKSGRVGGIILGFFIG